MAFDVKEVATKLSRDRIWFGFPHYAVLLWAALVTYTLFNTVAKLDGHLTEVNRSEQALNESTQTMAVAIRELQQHTQELREDSIRTRLILELKFPSAAREADQTVRNEVDQ